MTKIISFGLPAGALLALLCAPAYGTVRVATLRPSARSPQPIGTAITWTVLAHDTNPGPLTFQFKIASPGGSFSLVKDYNVGVLKRGSWRPPISFVWTPTGPEGTYQIQVNIKDFASGETATRTASYQVNPLVTASTPVVVPTANALVALFSAPSCPAGSTMRVNFQDLAAAHPAATTNWVNCNPPNTMTFVVAGMYPTTTYNMFAQTETGVTMMNGPTVSFTTGKVPEDVKLPSFVINVPPGPQTDTADFVLLHSIIRSPKANYPPVATDLSGNILWYYNAQGSTGSLITRPLANGNFLSFESSPAWNPKGNQGQVVRQVDYAGNIIRESNIGILQQQLLAMGVTDAQACNKIPSPPPVGSACMGAFSHDAIQTLPNGYTAVQADIEKIAAPGTQGDTSGLPVDIVGDIIVVLDTNWQVVWYWDSFEHAGGAPQLDINRAAVLNEACSPSVGCPFVYLLGSGVSPTAKDWLHGNTIYYWPLHGDLLWSSRNQDWVTRIDYNNGTGTSNILWRMGNDGDFTFNNIYSDPWPWFSGQHEVGIENNGAGPMTVYDNGNSRIAKPPIGLGKRCGPNDCNSRGMALTIDEVAMQVTPVESVDLGVFGIVLGSAQLLENGNYLFQPGQVDMTSGDSSYAIEILPTAGTDTGIQVLNLQGPVSYRAWQMPSLFAPPIS